MRPCEARAKGLKFAVQVAQRILEWLPDHTAEDCYAYDKTSHHGEDIFISERLLQRLPLAIEAKFQKTLKIPEWIRQAETYRRDGICPVVAFRPSQPGVKRPKMFVVLDMDDFLKLVL